MCESSAVCSVLCYSNLFVVCITLEPCIATRSWEFFCLLWALIGLHAVPGEEISIMWLGQGVGKRNLSAKVWVVQEERKPSGVSSPNGQQQMDI